MSVSAPVSGESALVARQSRVPPVLAILAATAVTPLYLTPFGHVTLRSCDLLVLLALALHGAEWVAGRRDRSPWRPLADGALATLLVVCVASVLAGDERLLWLKALKPWLLFGGLFWVTGAHVRSARDARRLLQLAFAGVAVQAAVGAAQVFAGRESLRALMEGPLGSVLYERDVIDRRLGDFYFNWNTGPTDPGATMGFTVYPSGTNVNGANYAVFLAGAAAVALGDLFGARRLPIAAASVAMAVLSITFKRSGALALGALLPFVAVGRRWRLAAWLAVAPALVWATLAAALVVRGVPLTPRQDTTPAVEVSGTGSTSAVRHTPPNGRIELWKHAWGLLRERPLTGVGLGQWELHGPVTQTRRGPIRWSNPESSLVGMAVETGFPGLLALGTFLGLVLWRTLRRARRDDDEGRVALAAGGLVAVLVAGASVNDMLMDDRSWPLLALACALGLGAADVPEGTGNGTDRSAPAP